MLFSIIIPIYNSQEYLIECLESLLRQTEKNFEVICVNDGSTDNSELILNSYKDKFEKMKIYSQSNKGQSSARNLGLKHSEAEYVLFLDSDDLLIDTALQKLTSCIKKNNPDILFFEGMSFLDGIKVKLFNDSSYHRPKFNSFETLSASDFFVKSIEQKKYTVSPCCYTYKKDNYRDCKYKDGIIHEDNLFTTNLILNNLKADVFCLNEELFLRRVRPNSTMTEIKTKRHVDGYLACATDLCERLNDYYDDELFCRKLSYFIQSLFINAILSNRGISKDKYSFILNLNCFFYILNMKYTSFKFLLISFFPILVDIRNKISSR